MSSSLHSLTRIGNDEPSVTQPNFPVPRVVLELVTPDYAAQLLARNPRNRPIQKAYRAALAVAMREGKFRNTADTIKVSRDGNLLDGQHRLAALVDSGVPQWLWIAYDVDPDAQDYMDRGHRRTVGNVLSIHGYKQGDILAAAIRWAVAMDSGKLVSKNERTLQLRLTPEETLEELERRPGIVSSVRVKEWAKTAPFRCSPSLFIAAHYLVSGISGQERADDFFHPVFSGIALEAGTGPFQLREVLLRDMKQTRRPPTVAQAYYIALAWNGWVAGRHVKQIKFYPDHDFPGFKRR